MIYIGECRWVDKHRRVDRIGTTINLTRESYDGDNNRHKIRDKHEFSLVQGLEDGDMF